MDPFRLCLILLPLAIYLLILGALNLSRRPRLVRGAVNTFLLAFAVSGLVIVGPMNLFMPEGATINFGGYVWVFMLSFYGLCVTLVVLLSKPRLIVLNASAQELKSTLGELAIELDSDARWAGDALALPSLGVQFHIEDFPAMRNVSLIATSESQSFEGWRRFTQALQGRLQGAAVSGNPQGITMLTIGLLLIMTTLIRSLTEWRELAQNFQDMFQL